MKRKFIFWSFCALVLPVFMLVQYRGSGERRAEQEKKVVITPDGKVAVPPNENMSITWQASRASTNVAGTDRK